jgi:hypothetical protein
MVKKTIENSNLRALLFIFTPMRFDLKENPLQGVFVVQALKVQLLNN